MSESAYSTFLQSVVREKRAEVETVCRRYGASDVKLFGSVARGDAGPDSDIDLMVTIDGPDYEQLMSMLGLGEELTKLLGTHVDVVARGAAKNAVTDTARADMVDV
ncbi:nucleotidyltransferase family protein [Rhodococcus erythropolis]|uniref:nucleotidyltransferase family protein n=1 Tax=Rhodococcus erythropolis TaxID=1833 RepID=UPI000878483D|nr:nucleotidyltransferase domain-containing protein [Rhodococcus erythropolis]OFV72808.1 nucleotidyltransferase domain protein [Rhodococcus erythropolis]